MDTNIDPATFFSLLSSNNIDEMSSILIYLQEILSEEYSCLDTINPFFTLYSNLLFILEKQKNENIINLATRCIVKIENYANKNKKKYLETPIFPSFLESIFSNLKHAPFSKLTKIHILNALFHIVVCIDQFTADNFIRYPLIDTLKLYFNDFDSLTKSSCVRMLDYLFDKKDDSKIQGRKAVFGNFECLQFLFSFRKVANSTTRSKLSDLIFKILVEFEIFVEGNECFQLICERSHNADRSEFRNILHLLRKYVSFSAQTKNAILDGSDKFKFSQYVNSNQNPECIELFLLFSFSFVPKPQLDFVDELFDDDLIQWNDQPADAELVRSFSGRMSKLVLNLYENDEVEKTILLKSLAVFCQYFTIDPSEKILFQFIFDSEEQENCFYLALIISKLSEEKKKLIFRSGILNTLQSIQFDSPLNDHYENFLNENFQDEEYVLPDEILCAETLKVIIDSIENNQLLMFDFCCDSNDLFNLCCELLPTADRSDLEKMTNFIFGKGLSIVRLPKSPPDPIPIKDYKDWTEEKIILSFNGNSSSFCLHVPILFTEMLFNESFFSEIIETEYNSNKELKDMFRNHSYLFKQKYSTAILAHEMKIKGYKQFGFRINKHIINPNNYLINSLMDIYDDPKDIFGPQEVEPLIVKDSILNRSSYMNKIKERFNDDNFGSEMNQFVYNLFEFLTEIHLQDPMVNMINNRFLDKVISQLSSPILTMGVYSPCTKFMIKYPFLFSFEDRLLFFKSLISEFNTVLNNYAIRYNKMHIDLMEETYFHMDVSRDNLFEEGDKIIKKFGKYKIFLEFSFRGEIGHGTGPNNEFFSLMCNEFKSIKKGLWRSDSVQEQQFCWCEKGLFPICTANEELFYSLGLFVAKALEMGIVIDLPINPAFFDMVFGRTVDIEKVDEQYSKNLENHENLFGLNFVYPVYSVEGGSIEMIPNGSNIEVDQSNVNEYVKLFTDFTCGSKIRPKIDAFVNGYNQISDIDYLKIFTSEELSRLMSGDDILLTKDILNKCVKIGSGFTIKSEQIQFLFDILVEFNYDQKLRFLQFCTGLSKLPTGGLTAIHPPLTIAKRVLEDPSLKEDDYLPSVLTCTHYLKLPAYSSKEIMRSKILVAIMEGRESFQHS